jgi:hypothetical protein
MKLALIGLASLVFFSILAFRSPKNSESQTAPSSPSSSTPVVVELFTSEGCSSCPPADGLLAQLENSQPVSGARVIAIEEHVDYWNHLGWVDPFSSPEWTARQLNYAAAFHRNGEYTPQMVVGGREEFVGSRSDLATKAIQKICELPPVAVTLTRLAPSEADRRQEPRFAVAVGKLTPLAAGDSAEVWLAVTESGLASEVGRGENAGRNLHHASLLRSLHRIGTADPQSDTAFEGTVSLSLKSEWKRENLLAVILVQEKKSRRILGAAALRVIS